MRQALPKKRPPSALTQPWRLGYQSASDSAYQDNATRELTHSLGLTPVVPPNPQRSCSWEYDQKPYLRCNQIERLFRRIKDWRRVFTRYDKLEIMFATFITVALIAEALQ
jgi:transposase